MNIGQESGPGIQKKEGDPFEPPSLLVQANFYLVFTSFSVSL